MIPNIQEGASLFAQHVWGAYSDIGLGAATFLPIIVPYFSIEQRSRSFYYVFVMMAIDGATSVTKLFYH